MKWLKLAWRNVFRNTRRTLLTAAVIGSGAIALLIAVGYVLATFQGLRETTIHAELGHLQVGMKGQFAAFQDEPLGNGLTMQKAAEVENALRDIPGVRFSMRRILFEGLISNGERSIGFAGQGVEPEKETKLSSVFTSIVEGNPLTSSAPAKGRGSFQILLAAELARTLNAKPGSVLTLLVTPEGGTVNAVDVTVAGIYRTGIPELDKRALMVPLEVAQTVLTTQKVSRMVVALDKTENTDAIAEQVARKLPEMDVRRWIDLAPFYNRVVTLYRNVFTVMGAIILVVVLLSSTNSMLMSIMERVREIGTMRAFGITELRIRTNFLIEGGMIGGLGSLVGIAVAIAIAVVVNILGIQMPPPPGRTTGYPLQILFDATSCLVAFVAMVAIGALAAWLPAKTAVKLEVVDALNHS